MVNSTEHFDVAVIGAGPSGAVSSALLTQSGYNVLVLEKSHFPRFSIGESLLPQSMVFLEQAKMLDAVQNAGFQYKNGAAFFRRGDSATFDFREKFTPGWGTTFQVQRGDFDKILADESKRQGSDIRYGQTVVAFEKKNDVVVLDVENDSNEHLRISAELVLDASGFGRVLPRLLGLDKPSTMPPRVSVFTHIQDNIKPRQHDRDKILIGVHSENQEVWSWLIPFSNGRASVGVVMPEHVATAENTSPDSLLHTCIKGFSRLPSLLEKAEFDTEVRQISGYSSDVTRLHGNGFALLGNAGEFLDPVFSSGVTIALMSAKLAADVADRELRGQQPDWEKEFAAPLQLGVNTFRGFVQAWYDGRLQDIIFSQNKTQPIQEMICAILAGYAWDAENPYVRDPSRLDTLATLCKG